MKLTIDYEKNLVLCEATMDGKELSSYVLTGEAADGIREYFSGVAFFVAAEGKTLEEAGWTL